MKISQQVLLKWQCCGLLQCEGVWVCWDVSVKLLPEIISVSLKENTFWKTYYVRGGKSRKFYHVFVVVVVVVLVVVTVLVVVLIVLVTSVALVVVVIVGVELVVSDIIIIEVLSEVVVLVVVVVIELLVPIVAGH